MDREYLIKLTVAVYKVTALFPEKEPLRYQIREKANQILVELLSTNPEINQPQQNQILRGIEALKIYFEIAKRQEWVNEKNLEILNKEYEIIAHQIKEIFKKQAKKPQESPFSRKEDQKKLQQNFPQTATKAKLSPEKRREKILKLLDYKKKITLSELRKMFFQVSQRTLRRDMEYLIRKGIVSRKRKGQKDVLYQLIEADKNSVKSKMAR
jgi:DNA-binding transcriptional ArsR family regulator